ncbi:MAG: ABC transporter permease, partial [Bacteroidales bacterium]|nr:ABC transporter permease [Bacteroidales bacterium]
MFGVSVLVFLMVHLAPGDPALIMLGEHASKESVEKLREEMGLNKPLYEQYIIFISKAVRGDFGNSIKSKQPVIDEFFERFPA